MDSTPSDQPLTPHSPLGTLRAGLPAAQLSDDFRPGQGPGANEEMMERPSTWERKGWKGKQINQANTDNDSPFPTSQTWLQKKNSRNILSDNWGKPLA